MAHPGLTNRRSHRDALNATAARLVRLDRIYGTAQTEAVAPPDVASWDDADPHSWPDEITLVWWWSLGEPQRAYLTDRILREVKPQPNARPAVRLPQLVPTDVPKYVRCVTAAMAQGKLDPASGRAMLYAAQLVINAIRAGAEGAVPKPRNRAAEVPQPRIAPARKGEKPKAP